MRSSGSKATTLDGISSTHLTVLPDKDDVFQGIEGLGEIALESNDMGSSAFLQQTQVFAPGNLC